MALNIGGQPVKGEFARIGAVVNGMVDQLGGQARVKGVSGRWKALTDNVNELAGNLTSQVRNIAQVTTAVAKGDLSQKITVDARGEILELKNTIYTSRRWSTTWCSPSTTWPPTGRSTSSTWWSVGT